jgi:cell division control protein 6
MLLLVDLNKQLFTTGEVAQVYRDVAQVLDLDVLTHRRIADLISELTMLGVINSRVVSRGRYGRTKEMWFSSGSSGIKETIFKDDRFIEEDLVNMDLSRYRALLR